MRAVDKGGMGQEGSGAFPGLLVSERKWQCDREVVKTDYNSIPEGLGK
jgi:hypothetical protein